jgi:adenosylhomocysteine nucleosidase
VAWHEPHCVAVTGLMFEARIAAGPGITVICSGKQLQLRMSVEAAVRRGCDGIISFGIAGGLAPDLPPGTCVIGRNIIADHGRYATNHTWAHALMETARAATDRNAAFRHVVFGDIAGSEGPVASTKAKRMLHEKTGAAAVDLESHVAARIAAEHRIPFAAFRIVTDPFDRALPPAAMVATRADGTVDVMAVVRSLVRCPTQLSTLVRLALDSWTARQSLVPSRRFLGPSLGLTGLSEHLLDVA